MFPPPCSVGRYASLPIKRSTEMRPGGVPRKDKGCRLMDRLLKLDPNPLITYP